MTIAQKLEEELTARLLWPDEIKTIMERVKAKTPAMEHRWNDVVEGYPPEMMAVLWLSTKTEAVAWIDECKPQHFARGMLT